MESANVIMDKRTGRSKGFGFVEMANEQEAQAAISALNGKGYSGRALTVNKARPRVERPCKGRGKTVAQGEPRPAWRRETPSGQPHERPTRPNGTSSQRRSPPEKAGQSD